MPMGTAGNYTSADGILQREFSIQPVKKQSAQPEALYNGLAMERVLYYHEHHRLYVEDLPYWLNLAQQSGSPVLELGCGTGRVTLPLAKAGHTAYGLDNDPAMLAFLQQRLPPGDSIHLVPSDITRFSLPQVFPLILLPCNTYSTLTGPQRASALDCVAAHLESQGVFAFSIPNPAVLADLPEDAEPEIEESFIHPNTGNPVQVSSAWGRRPDSVTVSWFYDHLLPDGKVERETVQVTHHLLNLDELARELTLAGFEYEFYGDFEKRDYQPDSDTLLVEAKKQK
jgi:SAM-dependent methyltransferase